MSPILLALLMSGGGCPGDQTFDVRSDGFRLDGRKVSYACDTIDVLFVIDNSNTMKEEQQNLVANFSKFINAIESVKPPLKSYHLGVVTTDLGSGPFPIKSSVSECKPGGDRGMLQHEPRLADCKATYNPFLVGPSPDIAKDFACIASLGTGGCGFEQQMESALKALTDQPYNEAFHRRTAPLAVIFITDEDDCSAADPSVFDPESRDYGDLKTRCVEHTDKLYPVQRYIDAFRGIQDDPQRLIIAAVTGPRGKVTIDVTKHAGQEPVCTSDEFGAAAPGNRFHELLTAFGPRGVLKNICDGDMAGGLADVINTVVERVCLQ